MKLRKNTKGAVFAEYMVLVGLVSLPAFQAINVFAEKIVPLYEVNVHATIPASDVASPPAPAIPDVMAFVVEPEVDPNAGGYLGVVVPPGSPVYGGFGFAIWCGAFGLSRGDSFGHGGEPGSGRSRAAPSNRIGIFHVFG